jgi:ribosomal protein S18
MNNNKTFTFAEKTKIVDKIFLYRNIVVFLNNFFSESHLLGHRGEQQWGVKKQRKMKNKIKSHHSLGGKVI